MTRRTNQQDVWVYVHPKRGTEWIIRDRKMGERLVELYGGRFYCEISS